MIYQPRNIQPSFISIDGTEDNVFKMEVNTNNLINAYKLRILDFDNNLVYNGSKVTLASPVYNGDELTINVPASIGLVNGNNYKWIARLYQPQANMKITYGVLPVNSPSTTNIYLQKNINIKPDMQLTIGAVTRTISSYDITTGLAVVSSAFGSTFTAGTNYTIYSDFIETVPENVVYVRANPVVSITNLPTTLDKKYFNFIGSYTQADNVPLVYFIWNLYLVTNNGREILYTTDKIYSANVQFTYDGFKTGQSYQIELFVETEYGIVVSTGLQSFNVQYNILDYLQQPIANFDANKNAIQIDWTSAVTYPADNFVDIQEIYDTPYVKTNSYFTDKTTLSYDNGDLAIGKIPDLYRITLQFKPNVDFFYDYASVVNNLIPVANVFSTDVEGARNIFVFIHGYKLVAITPTLTENTVALGNLATPPSGQVNNSSHVYINQAVDIATQQYITFTSQGYTEKIASYDSSTKLVTFDKVLPFTPVTGDEYYLNDTVSADIYSAINNVSTLQNSNIVNPSADYIWDDNDTWPTSDQESNYYWVEGGTEIGRIANYWWKAEITNTNITIIRGGV